MQKLIVLIIEIGTIVGIGGGFVGSDKWVSSGLVIIVVGPVVLGVFAAAHKPDAVLDSLAEDFKEDPQPPKSDVFTMESELKRRDRGAEKRNG